MFKNLVHNWNQSPARKIPVWFPGTTAIRKGRGLCYDIDVAGTGTGETATDPWGRRGNSVALPSTSNNLFFAGVATQYYPAMSGGQRIDIWQPGSICPVQVGFPSTIFSQTAGTLHTCSVHSADAGAFTFKGLSGRGTAMALETKAQAAGGDVTFKSVDGAATTAWSSPSLTITATGVGTACGYGDATIDPTEFLVIALGGADDAAGGDAATGEMAVTGEYPVVTAPSADTITIATDIGDVDLTFYVIKNTYPCILAYLMEGEESGLQEVLSPQDAVTTIHPMIGGTSIICGGYTMLADSGGTLADGLIEGQKKAVVGLGTLTTKDYVLTVTSGMQKDGATTLASFAIDAAGEEAVMQWHGNVGDSTTGEWFSLQDAGITAA
jgi:hypothetical protein